ncbi:MAG: DUF1508 domain-containing protein [Clostridiales bacterium]|nr:DUF1508 domain-containing protein [Clostridiales bacterium]
MDTIKAFVKKLLAYFSANPVFAFVVIGCCVFIAILLVVVFTLKFKAKKTNLSLEQQPDSAPIEKESTTINQVEEITETEDEKEVVETIVSEPLNEVIQEAPVQKEEPKPVEIKKEVKKEVKEEPKKEVKEEKPKTEVKKETLSEYKQPEKTEPVKKEESIAKIEPINKPKSKRYNGKWVICHLVTKEDKNSENNVEEAYFFELHASNGEKLLSSEEYTSYNGALKGIETHKANILKNNFRVGLSKKGEYIFKLLSGKNTLLCTGENYPTRLRCENAIDSTKRFAETAVVDENIHDIIVQIPPDTDEEVEYDQTILGKWIISKTVAEDGDEIYYFELFASNGEKLLSSEEYTSYSGALNGINTHKNNIEKDNFRIALTKRGDYIYKLLTGNGQLLCLGEHYKTRRRCENAVESVKRFSKSSPILTASNVVPKD